MKKVYGLLNKSFCITRYFIFSYLTLWSLANLLEFTLCEFGDILPLFYQTSVKPAQFFELGKFLDKRMSYFSITNEQQMMP